MTQEGLQEHEGTQTDPAHLKTNGGLMSAYILLRPERGHGIQTTLEHPSLCSLRAAVGQSGTGHMPCIGIT